MERLKAWVHEHPKLTAAIVIGLLLVFYLMRKRSAAGSSGVSGSQTDPNAAAEIAAGAQLQAQELQAQEQMAALQSQSDIYSQYFANQRFSTSAQEDVALKSLDTQLGISRLQAEVQTTAIGAQASTNAALIAALTSGNTGQQTPTQPLTINIVSSTPPSQQSSPTRQYNGPLITYQPPTRSAPGSPAPGASPVIVNRQPIGFSRGPLAATPGTPGFGTVPFSTAPAAPSPGGGPISRFKPLSLGAAGGTMAERQTLAVA